MDDGFNVDVGAVIIDRVSRQPAPVNFDRFEQSSNEKISFQKSSQEAAKGPNHSQGTQTSSESSQSSPQPYLAPKGVRTGNLHPPKEKSQGQAASGKGSGKGNGMGM